MIRSRRIFRNFHPAVVLGMGGFNSVAPILLAWKRGVPSCIHESNAVAGKANCLAARMVSVVACGFEAAGKCFSGKQIMRTGTPVRSSFRVHRDQGGMRKKLGLSNDCPVVLVIGGSQGARGVNLLVTKAAMEISSLDIQWLHTAGRGDESWVRDAYAVGNKTARVTAFCHEMEEWYAASDLVIARAGGSTLAEIAAASLPSILIPYPHATDRHQQANASRFVQAGAAVMREETSCTAGKLAADIQDILTDKNRRKKMADAAEKLKDKDAHLRLAEVVEKLGKGELFLSTDE